MTTWWLGGRDWSFKSALFERLDALLASNARIERQLGITQRAIREGIAMAKLTQADIDELKAEVTENTNVQAGALVLLDEFIKRIDEAGNDAEEVKAVTQAFKDNRLGFAKAIADRTPAAGQPAPPA